MNKIFLSICLLSIEYADAQIADSSQAQAAIANIIDEYRLSIGKSAIYNGIEYTGYPDYYEGTAYYKSADWQKGQVYFDGVLYTVYLKYDMLKDQVIIRHFNELAGVVLFSPRVKFFTLQNDKFIYIPDSDIHELGGFYQQLQNGKISLLARRQKILDENIITGRVIKKFDVKSSYYIHKDDGYYRIKNEADILDLMGERKKEIRLYLKSKKMKYKKNPETVLSVITEYYNQLNH